MKKNLIGVKEGEGKEGGWKERKRGKGRKEEEELW